jgi:hypothetical protein
LDADGPRACRGYQRRKDANVSHNRSNDWRSAARPRGSVATEGLVSCNVRVGQHPSRIVLLLTPWRLELRPVFVRELGNDVRLEPRRLKKLGKILLRKPCKEAAVDHT